MTQHQVFQLTAGKGCSIHNRDENSDMSVLQRAPLYQIFVFLLLVTSDIPPVSGNNDAITRLSSIRYFP